MVGQHAMNDEDYMKLAIGKAREGIAQGQTPFGACLVKGGAVISCTHNAVWATCDSTAHAEVCAIREACACLRTVDLSGCTLYSTCEPCPMCFSACHWARIETIVYGARIDDAKRAGFNELSLSNETMKRLGGSRLTLTGDVLREENLALLAAWAVRPDKRLY